MNTDATMSSVRFYIGITFATAVFIMCGFITVLPFYDDIIEIDRTPSNNIHDESRRENNGIERMYKDDLRARLAAEDPKVRLPNVIIAGCPKCGTRALLNFLSLNPYIVPASQETHYFDNDDNYEKGVDWYKSFFPPRIESQIGIEKTPAYFASLTAPKRIHDMNSSIRIIIIVCEPVKRAISRYAQYRSQNGSSQSFDERFFSQTTGELEPSKPTIQGGIYYNHLQLWLKLFSIDQLFFVDGDRLVIDPVSEVRRVETFLNIPHYVNRSVIVFDKQKGFYCQMKNGHVYCLGETKGRPHPAVDPVLKQKIADFYQPHNELFMKAVGRRFKWDVWN